MKLIRQARDNRKGQRMCIGLVQFPDVTVAELKQGLKRVAAAVSASKSPSKLKRA
jgi:hypothetical protein